MCLGLQASPRNLSIQTGRGHGRAAVSTRRVGKMRVHMENAGRYGVQATACFDETGVKGSVGAVKMPRGGASEARNRAGMRRARAEWS
jgi:hypothetical protein